MSLDKDNDFNDRYRSARNDPRELRSRSANRTAALALIGAIVVIVLLLAVFS